MEHFYTIQGEGYYSGHAAYFVRLGGCDVGCTWCDVKESWEMDKHPKMSSGQIVDFILTTPAKICVLTGGEPLLHDLTDLCNMLHKHRIRVHIETSGSSPLSGDLDWITFSPKRFKKPLEEIYAVAHELKIVIAHVNDFRWALGHAEKINPSCKLYVQPEWEQREALLPHIISFVKEHPNWILSLQTHKYIGVD